MLNTEAEKVREALLAKGLETPMTPSEMNPNQKYNRIKELLTEVVSTLGLDLTDDSLAETPHRIAKMYVHEIFSGLDYDNFPKISVIENKMSVDEMVKVSN
ncbi:GTP cyclohydrolase I, partial [Vibrio splendidus]|uniref:GTP cyclohydrolase I n=1 Tax=Vibrio splendidus TaxID=29497 RepID=UPI0018E4968C